MTNTPIITRPPKCKTKVDLAFLLDSSHSISSNYNKVKSLLKSIARTFGVTKYYSRAGVITFSDDAICSIKLNDCTDIECFDTAVDAIALMGGKTRIDRGLCVAQESFFIKENGAREGACKVVVLLTDGSQTHAQDVKDPAKVADDLRKEGVNVVVVGKSIIVLSCYL